MPAILTFLSMLIAVFQIGKEVVPIVKPMISPAATQNNSGLAYRYNDGNYAYYSNNDGKVWARVNRIGSVEYAYNPPLIR